MGNPFVVAIAAILAASTFGFLLFNFYPAKIFMGDTGALFLGFMISVLALLGFKGITMFALIIPDYYSWCSYFGYILCDCSKISYETAINGLQINLICIIVC